MASSSPLGAPPVKQFQPKSEKALTIRLKQATTLTIKGDYLILGSTPNCTSRSPDSASQQASCPDNPVKIAPLSANPGN